MSCTVGRSYIVEAGNTPYNIAQEQLGDGNLWREIKKPDGSSLTDNDASNLPAGQELCIPGSTPPSPSPSGKGNLQNMLEALGAFESGLPSGDPNQYKVENSLGFMGKYQFGEPLLIDLDYYKADVFYGNGADKNYWRGTWIGKRGINNQEQFKTSPDVQEAAIREAFNLNWQRVNSTLEAQGQSVNNYLGQQKTFIDNGV